MNLIGAIYAVRRYGLKGVLNFVLRHMQKDKLSNFLRLKNTASKPQPGITIIGTFDHPSSLSKVLRDLALMLKRAGIPYQALNIPCEKPIPESEFIDLLTPREEFITNMYSHIIGMRRPYAIPDKRCRMHVIEFWEFEDGFKDAQPEMTWLRNIVAMSDFNLMSFKRLLPHTNIGKILYPFQFNGNLPANLQSVRSRYGIGPDDFVVFFNFDYYSGYYRKNPEGLILAFSKAFPDNPQTKLVLKTMRAKARQELHEQLQNYADKCGLANRLICIDNFIPQEDLVALSATANVYASLHRGEGFGLGIAEAMSLSVPVVVTDYSATSEFCNTDNALLIPYHLVKVPPSQVDVDAYHHVSTWAEPDTDAAAEALKRLYHDPELRKRLGENGKHFIENYFSPENFKKSIEAFLKE